MNHFDYIAQHFSQKITKKILINYLIELHMISLC